MTIRHYIIVSTFAALLSTLAALILSMSTPTYAGAAYTGSTGSVATLVNVAGTVSTGDIPTTTPILSTERYNVQVEECAICPGPGTPISLPPTSGSMSEVLYLAWSVSEAIRSVILSLFG